MQSKTLKNGIHALTEGQGPPIILLPGWPETVEAYTDMIPLLSPHFEVWALDPPGVGDSARSTEGYDTKTISRILAEAVEGIITAPYHLVGHDVGAWIAYAWAAQFPESLQSLTLLDSSIPGNFPNLPFPLPGPVNEKLWQFGFNSLPDIPEILTKGRERELLDYLFNQKAAYPDRITRERRDRYVECYSRPGAMTQGFEYYRAVAMSSAQNKAFGETLLQMPVLALGGESASGGNLTTVMERLARNVRGGVIEDCGHYVMEEQPGVVARRLMEFVKSLE